MPQISVIVPVYKVEPYLRRCVNSILNQNYTDFELILIDDGSPDNCGNICDDYADKDNRVIVIHKENGGHSDARNAGIEWAISNSNSEWITFIDSDDWVSPYYLQVLMRICQEKNVSISSCGCQKVGSDSDVIDYNHEILLNVGNALELVETYDSFTKFNVSVVWGRLYKKHIFLDVRFPVGRFFEDEYVIYKLLFEQEKIAATEQGLYYYFQNEDGIMASGLTPKRMNDQLDVFYEQIEYYYSHKIVRMFQSRLYYYCSYIYKYSKAYGNISEYRIILKNHLSKSRRIIEEKREYLPDLLLKYGYKKWASGRAMALEIFKNDLQSVNQEKGLIFAIIWAIKNYWSIFE